MRACGRPLITYIIMLGYAHVHKYMGVRLIGVANKTRYLGRSWALPNDSKHNEVDFLTIPTDSLYLRVAQMPRSRDLAIFCADDRRRTDIQTDCVTPAAHARTRGKYTVKVKVS
jgi:hypothetical protein